jgi:hypothetical protein
VLLALTAVSACLGAAAYATNRPADPVAGIGQSIAIPIPGAGNEASSPAGDDEVRPQARFVESPAEESVSDEVQFRFHVLPRSEAPAGETAPAGPPAAAPTRRFQCKLDRSPWAGCSSPQRIGDLAEGGHAFRVRALDRAGRPGPVASHSWRRVAPAPRQVAPLTPAPQAEVEVAAMPFSIELRGQLEELYPGHPHQQLDLVVSNPNSSPIEVTSLTVAISPDPPSCSAENFALTQASVSPATPLVVPANGSLELPTATVSAPSLGMLNLPVNQDPCLGVEVPLAFSGEARG